ncbi:hypothetical protein [Endothiovibrio diazotrophicus]
MGEWGDLVDQASAGEERERRAALAAQRARAAAAKAVAVRIEGVACCADCEEPLNHHRRPRGLCVECAERRERRARVTRR